MYCNTKNRDKVKIELIKYHRTASNQMNENCSKTLQYILSIHIKTTQVSCFKLMC